MNIRFLAVGITATLLTATLPAFAQHRSVTKIIHEFDLLPSSVPRIHHPIPLARYSWPVQGSITSGYGWRWGRMHQGVDIAAPTGTPVSAAASGVVVYAGWKGNYGNLVSIRHPDGSLTRYGHNSQILVQEGQVVQQGQAIALVGSTGRSTGPHCHFEIHPPGLGAVNPMGLLPGV